MRKIVYLHQKKKMKLGLYLTPHTKINTKFVNNIDIRPETIQFLKENTEGDCMIPILVMIFPW